MKKSFFLSLAIAGAVINTAQASTTALSTTGNWETATGDLASLLGQSAPATWTYDTDLSTASPLPTLGLPSSGSIASYSSSNYILSGTAAPSLFDGNQFMINILDNTIASIDTPSSDIVTAMVNKGLDPDAVGDALIFTTTTELPGTGYTESFSLFGLMVFDKDFFSGSLTTLASADVLLSNSLFTYAELTHGFNFGTGFQQTGSASYAQIPSAVPLPATALLFTPALLGFLGLRRKKAIA
jgi:hypothetical protein